MTEPNSEHVLVLPASFAPRVTAELTSYHPAHNTVSCIHLGPEHLHPAWLLLPPQAQSLLFWSSGDPLFP